MEPLRASFVNEEQRSRDQPADKVSSKQEGKSEGLTLRKTRPGSELMADFGKCGSRRKIQQLLQLLPRSHLLLRLSLRELAGERWPELTGAGDNSSTRSRVNTRAARTRTPREQRDADVRYRRRKAAE